MTFWRLTAREVSRRPGRATLTVLSIAIGIGAFISVSLGTTTTRHAYQQMYQEISGRSALEITADGGGLFDQNLAAALEQIPGIQAAVPTFQRPGVLFFNLPERTQRFDLMVMGIDPARDREARQYELRAGEFFDGMADRGALLEVGFAEGAGIRVGDQVRVMATGSRLPQEFTVTGLLAPRGAAGFNKGGVVFLTLQNAQRHFGRKAQVTTIDLVLQPGAEEKAVAESVRQILPVGLDVHRPATRTQLAEGMVASVEQGLNLSSAFALALAIFIVLNAFLMNISERRPQLAVLRAVGATRRQVVSMLLWEGLMMGTAGTVLGCLLGAGGGYLIMLAITRMFVSTPPPILFTPGAFQMAAVLGPLLSVAAAAVPAFLTTRISPLEAMQPMVSTDRRRPPWWVTTTGTVVMLISGILLAGTVRGWITPSLAVPMGVVFMASFVLLIPRFLGPLDNGVGRILAPILRLEGRLAQRQVRRRPVRSALTIGVLYMAVGVGIGLGTTIINTIHSVHAWYQRTVVGDFFLRAAFPNTTTGQTVAIPLGVGDEVRALPGIEELDTVNFFTTQVSSAAAPDGGRRVFVIAREYNAGELPLDLYHADARQVRNQLYEGQVVVGTVLAKHLGLNPGDEITVKTFKQGEKSLRVAALAVDYMVGGNILYMHRPTAQRLFDLEGANAFIIHANSDALGEVREGLAKVAEKHQLMLQSATDLNRLLDTYVAGVEGSLWGILALGLVVAAFGIANTLTMNVLEQTRELALLRVVAMTRGQIRKMIVAQAAIMGTIGLGLGLLAGLYTAFAISRAMLPLLGYPVPFIVQPWLLAGSFAVGMVLVLLAALWPAERAARLDVLIALQYE